MPAVRCQWYDDDGRTVLETGCRGEDDGSCTYVHPSSHLWSHAIRRRTARRGRGAGTIPSSRDNGWNMRKASSDFDNDGWKSKGYSNPSAASPISPSEPEKSKRAKVLGTWGSQSESNSTASGGASGWGTGGWGEDVQTASAQTIGDTDAWGGGGWGGGGWSDAPIDPPAPEAIRPTNLQVDTNDNMVVDSAPIPPLSASSYRATSQAPSVCATPQSAFPPFAVPASVLPQNMTRSEIHSGIIKNAVRVTRIRIELEDLRRQLASWKTTQLSPQFHRVSAAAGDRLNSIRRDLGNQISAVEIRRKSAENDLIRLGNLPSSAPNIVDVDRDIMSYTHELKAWLMSFTAFSALPGLDTKASDFSSDMELEPDGPDTEPAVPLSSLAQIQERLTKLDEILDEVEQTVQDPEIVSHDRNAVYIEKVISVLRRKANGGDQGVEKPVEEMGPVAGLQSSADDTVKKFEFQAEQVVHLMKKIETTEQRIADLEEQRKQDERFSQMMQLQLEKLESWDRDRQSQRKLIAEQIGRCGVSPLQQATPILDDALLAHVRDTVATMIETEVVPALNTARQQYVVAIKQRTTSLEQSIQPTLDKTNELCRRAELLDP
ncbi:hypothetical protein C8R43DRAFT_992045 [Mycena crocata]|nr:hypothetical protein C8R43DRAFT_992045 [Mycena crocata]